ncbi:Transposase [uncultured Roseburia sp.]|nr:Transposase [uncultured Roseburia sp.]
MPLKDMLLCCLSKKGLTTAFELRNYFKDKGELPMALSVQGYLQQRKRLNPEVFPYLNRRYLMDFYHSEEPKLWKGYLLAAVDGSKAEVPNSKENRETFGNSGNQHSRTGQVRALVSGMYDILNHFYLDIEIEHISVSEIELAKRNLKHLREMKIRQPVLAVFDRGYPSIEFIDFLEMERIHYIIRLSSNDYKSEREQMQSEDEKVILKHSSARLQKIRQKHPERYEEMKRKEETIARILKSTLPSGNELVLMTNLPDTIAAEELADLYYQRWEIEKKYHTLKNKMKFESVTGKASVYVYQDFWSQVLVYNMIQDIRNSADEEAAEAGRKSRNKYLMHTNENTAIGLFKENMLKILLEPEEKKCIQKLNKLQKEMERYVLPIRELPGNERRKNISNKYKNNQKSSF